MTEAIVTNAFTTIQNQPEQLELLQARRSVQTAASQLLTLQIAVVIITPSALALISFVWPTARPIAAVISLIAAALDVLLFDRMQKRYLATIARLQERFDCNVFALPWNVFIAGDPPHQDQVRKLAEQYAQTHGDARERGWYAETLAALPMPFARLAAQRLNLSYDKTVRSNYRAIIIAVVVCLLALCILAAFQNGLTAPAFILAVLVPAVPMLNWSVREFFRQFDAIKKLTAVMREIEAIWTEWLIKQPTPENSEKLSRGIQDASFVRRSTSPIVFEKLYWSRRTALELRMTEAAGQMIKEAEGSVGQRASYDRANA